MGDNICILPHNSRVDLFFFFFVSVVRDGQMNGVGSKLLTCGRGCPVTRQVSSRVSPSLMV